VEIPIQYSKFSFSEDMAMVYTEEKFESDRMYIGIDGKLLPGIIYGEAWDFNDGLAAVRKKGDSLWGFIDKTGKVVIKPVYSNPGKFNEGFAPVTFKGRQIFIDKNGNEAFPYRGDRQCLNYGGGIFVATDKNNDCCAFRYDPTSKTFTEVFKVKNGLITRFINGYAPFLRFGSGWGIVDASGKEVLAAGYESIWGPVNGIYLAKKNGEFGYLNSNFSELLPFEFENAGFFDKNGLAYITIEGVEGYIDKKGTRYFKDKYTIKIPFAFEIAGPFNHGLAFVGKKISSREVLFAIIDTTGRLLTDYRFNHYVVSPNEMDYNDAPVFANGFLDQQKDKKYTFINRFGKQVGDLNLENIYAKGFNKAGLAVVMVNKKWGLMDTTGKFIIPPKYDTMYYPSGNITAVYSDSIKKWKFINLKDSAISRLFFNEVLYYPEDAEIFCVKDTTKKLWGYINKKGAYILKPIYPQAGNFYAGLAAVADEKNKWGFIDKTGKLVIPYNFTRSRFDDYDRTFNFSKGISNTSKFENARLFTEQEFALIDKTGKVIVPFSKVAAYTIISNNLAYNLSNGMVYNHKGEVVFQFDTKQFFPDFKDEFYNGIFVNGFINNHIRIKTQYKPNEKGTCGMMDKNWQIVVDLGVFEDIGLYSNGLIPAKKNGKWGYLKVSK
jgi:hypothetical protein